MAATSNEAPPNFAARFGGFTRKVRFGGDRDHTGENSTSFRGLVLLAYA